MVQSWRIGIAQVNSTVGDLRGNCEKIAVYVHKARGFGADLVTFPEMVITGYPPEDLLLKPKFVDANLVALKELAEVIPDMVAVVGFVDREGGALFNAAAVLYDGSVRGVYRKTLLPNYGVFDEKRYFQPGTGTPVFKFGELTFGVNICEDVWFEQGPTRVQASLGARLILNINASPYDAGKYRQREEVLRDRARKNGVFISYTNLVGGQDELVFDGQSLVISEKGDVVARALAFKEDLLIVDIPLLETFQGRTDEVKDRDGREAMSITISHQVPAREKAEISPRIDRALEPPGEIYEALLLGLHDYVVKNGFKKVAIGLSGGIDSAIVAALAADTLGKDDVVGVFMPSRYTSRESEEDAGQLAGNLGIRLITLPIDRIFASYVATLDPVFQGLAQDVTEENIQARIRGNMLMALSNKFGWLVLTTGNKSEMSVGYATLYGDMAGGFAVIKDVPKTMVYDLALYRNRLGPVIPERILTKEPTAELKPDQKDRDTLPPYALLDPILREYIEEDKHPEEIVSPSLEREIVTKVSTMVDKSEYKRRQSPPGIKITPKALGRDRRMPITNKYRG
jgi:NAD+ synthase (glutamine-hydrolysing)